ncbi:hypothetical protein KC19_10G167700 [Ceratodon purpureus]|uniref:F-box domain-containing protein n=1 Tax=Ceratodon purpureus TaxID=3225 RepID=A0A8T0GP61_CERPU|nr:hypothetical protein KC19_10G167700 [Ceratodon purpureus]
MRGGSFEDTVMGDEVGLIPALPDDVARQCLLRVPPHSHAQLQRVSRRWRELVNSSEYYEERKREGTSEKFVCMLQAMEPLQSASGRKPAVSTGSVQCSPAFGISVLNVHQRSWGRLPPIPDFPEGLPIFSRLVAVDGKLFVLGGWNPATYETLQTVYIFNFVTQTWSRGAPMPTSRSFFACAAVDNYIFVAGGHDNSKTALKSAEVYSLDTDQWAPLAPMNQERDESTGLCFEGNFYAVSGYSTDSQGQFTQSAEVYNPSTNSWTLLEGMWSLETETSRAAGPFAVMFGKLYTLNGQNLCCYNAATGAWSVVESIPDGEVNPVCVAVVDDALLISGPSRNSEDSGFGTFLYKPSERAVTKRCKSEWESIERQVGFDGVAHFSHAIEI